MKNTPHVRRTSLNVCRLEARDNPAGSVDAIQIGSILTLTGDDYANEIQLVQTNGILQVVGLNNTEILGGPTFSGVTGLKTSLADGDDIVTIDSAADFVLSGAATFNLGDGDNILSLATSQKVELGSLTVMGGEGQDTVTVQGGALEGSAIKGNVSISVANGRNSQEPPYLDSTILFRNVDVLGTGGLKVTGGEGDEELTLDTVKVSAALNASGGDGALRVTTANSTIGSMQLNSFGPATGWSTNGTWLNAANTIVNGAMSLRSNSGTNLDFIGGSSGNISITNGPKSDSAATFAGTTTVNGNLTIRGGRHTVTADNGADVTVTGNIAVTANYYASLHAADGRLKAKSINLNGKGGADLYMYDDGGTPIFPAVITTGTMTMRGRSVQFYQQAGQVNIGAELSLIGIDDTTLFMYDDGGTPLVSAIVTTGTLTMRGRSVEFHQQAGQVNIGAGLSLIGIDETTMSTGTSNFDAAPLATTTVLGPAMLQGKTVRYSQAESLATFSAGLTLQAGERASFESTPWQLPTHPNAPDYPSFGNGATTTLSGGGLVMKGQIVSYSQTEGVATFATGFTLQGTESATVESYPKDYGVDESELDDYGIGAKITAGALSMTGGSVGYYQEEGEATFTNGISLLAKTSASFRTEAGYIETPFGTKLAVPAGGIVVQGSSAEFVQSDGVATVAGGVTVKGTEGASFDLEWYDAAVGAKMTVGGSIAVDAGEGSVGFANFGDLLHVDGDVSVKGQGLSRTYFEGTTGTEVGGSVSVSGATGYHDYFGANGNLSVGEDLTISLGNGANYIEFGVDGGTIQLTGELTVTTGNGSDTIALSSIAVGGKTTINTGAGADRLHFLKNSIFNGLVAADLGTGADLFEAGMPLYDFQNNLVLPAGTVTFNAASSVKLGAGNDRAGLGVANDPDGKVLFGPNGSLTLDGGANLDFFDAASGQFALNKVTPIGFEQP